MATEAMIRAIGKYNSENTVQKIARFNKKTDADILEHIKDKPFQTYIKKLIRKEIKESEV